MIITKELLQKFHEGSCTEEERKAVEKWLASSDDVPSKLDPHQQKDFEKSTASIWSKVSKAVPESPDPSGPGGTRAIPVYKRLMRYAAAAILLSAAAFSVYHFSKSGLAPNETRVAGDYQTIQTKRGQKRTVTLSDGSTIRMNYETELKAPARFKGDERVVYLTGHAHFNIVRNPEKPFIIFTENSETRVLGTSFDVKTDKSSDKTEIVVTSGKVKFSRKGQKQHSVTLTVNKHAILQVNRQIIVNEVDAGKVTAWKDNRLAFEDQTIREIIKVLEPWYDVKISVTRSSLLDERLTLSYKDPSLEKIVDRMSSMLDFDYRIEGQEVIIY